MQHSKLSKLAIYRVHHTCNNTKQEITTEEMDSERNIAAKKTVSRPVQESSLQDNSHHGNVQNVVLLTANSELVIGSKLQNDRLSKHSARNCSYKTARCCTN